MKKSVGILRSIVLLVLVELVSLNSSKGQSQYDFDKLSIDDGLTSSSANSILQDKNGFIWIGTWNGLNRYDGKEVITYQPVFRDSSSLSNREITTLCEASDGIIWIGTSFGLSSLNPKTNIFTHYDFDYNVTAIFEDSEKKIWVGTSNSGLRLIDPQSGENTQYLDTESINHIYEDSRHEFWIATNYGLLNFNRQSKRFQRYLKNPRSHPRFINSYPYVEDIAESSDGFLWVASNNQGIFRLEIPMNRENLIVTDFTPTEGVRNVYALSANNIEFDQKGNLWIGTWGNGVYMYDARELNKKNGPRNVHVYRNSITDPFSLGGNDNISTIYADKQGQLWIASSVINITNINANGISRYNTQTFNNGILENTWVNCISSNKQGELWVGTQDGILIYDHKLQGYQKKSFVPNNLLNKSNERYPGSIKSILFDDDGNLWIGSDNAGVIFHPKQPNNEYSRNSTITLNQNTLPSIHTNDINQIIESKHLRNTVWIASNNNGLLKCERVNNHFNLQQFSSGNTKHSLSHYTIRAIAEDGEGRIWIGTQNGLNCLDPKTNTVQQFYYSENDINSINNNIINVIYVDSNDDIWIGSNSGINKVIFGTDSLNYKNIDFKSFSQNKFLNSEIIQNIVEDDHKNIWLGVYNGIVKFNIEQETVEEEVFVKEYSRVKIGRLSSCKQDDGSFLFGGGNGFLTFHPDNIGSKTDAPKVQLTNLMIFNKPVGIGDTIDHKILLKQSITYTDTLALSYKHKVVTLFFSIMDFNAPDKTEFAYYLDGFDKDWNFVKSRNSATYTDIPPGKYTFKVKGANSSGIWTAEPRELLIIISPPWWRTTIAYAALLILVIFTLFIIERRFILKLKERNALLVEKVKLEKEYELNDLKLHFFTNITHELRTPLTLILGPVEELAENKAAFGKHARNIELIEKNAKRLLRLINQLMEFRKVEKGKMNLEVQQIDIISVLVDVFDSFKGLANTKNIQFNLNHTDKSIWAEIDRDKFDKILFNLLSNAFKFTEVGGQVEINCGITNHDQCFFIEIKDTGIGIAEDMHEKIFERFYQINQRNTLSTGGIGLYLTKAFVDLHQGTINLLSEPGNGSCFRIEIPIKSALIQTSSNEFSEYEESRVFNEEITNHGQNEFQPAESVKENKSYILLAEDDLEMNEFLQTISL